MDLAKHWTIEKLAAAVNGRLARGKTIRRKY